MGDQDFHLHLLCTSLSFPGAPVLPSSSQSPLAAALHSVHTGTYIPALRAALRALDLLSVSNGTLPESSIDWFEALERAAATTLAGGAAAAEQRQWLALAAVAALYAFTQANLTGPPLGASAPESPFDLVSEEDVQPGGAGAAADSAYFGVDSASAADRWAADRLAENGEDLVGRIQLPQYLLLALSVLQAAPADAPPVPPAWHWWAARAALLQQRILSGRSATLRERLLVLTERVVADFAGPGAAGLPQGAPSAVQAPLAAAALLEAAMMETAYGHVGPSKEYTERAGKALGMRVELTGALGVRTVHQQEARAQLILHIELDAAAAPAGSNDSEVACGEESAALDAALTERSGTGDEVKGLTVDDEADVLRHPKLVGADGGAAAAAPSLPDLPPLHQAVVLAKCLNVKKGTTADGLQPWEVAAHADAVLQQPRGEFLLRAAAHLAASRLERQRSRTRERALLELEGLAEAVDAAGDVPAQARMR